ncbi:MFS transporter [Paenibacillus sp. M1]|uniref:MFS transporter n=1 Tax=Paenibacillus haidiansis TaxID=1574488 RepID=A0ABU7VNV3_9BACL
MGQFLYCGMSCDFYFCAKFSLITLLIALMLTGFVSGLAMPTLPTLLSAEFVQERATAMGVYNFVRYLGMAAAPMIGSVLYPLGGTALLIGVTAVFVGVVVFATRKLLPLKNKQRA